MEVALPLTLDSNNKVYFKFTMILKHILIWAIYQEKEMLIDLAKMAKIHKFGLANSLLDSPMANTNGNPDGST